MLTLHALLEAAPRISLEFSIGQPGTVDPVPPPMTPPAPIDEPQPDRLPDESPLPNPDENDNPPQSVGTIH